MLSSTKEALEHFDNQHDFERMAADLLNALGYQGVEPMAPNGGPDGGRDIAFYDGDEAGIAFVTTRKDIDKKFAEDLAGHEQGDGLIAFFCTVGLSPSKKRAFSEDAIKKGFRIEFFDVERLRSHLDGRLTDLRRRYLHIEDSTSALIRSEVARLLSFPAATADEGRIPTILESCLGNQLPRRLFDLLMRHEERDTKEVPLIGDGLHSFVTDYCAFRVKVTEIENELYRQISMLVGPEFKPQWAFYLRYAVPRFAGASRDQMVSGSMMLNYGLDWDNVERMYLRLAQDSKATASFSAPGRVFSGLEDQVAALAAAIKK